MAEHTFALLLALARKVPVQHQLMQQGQWKRRTGRELFGSTLGIIGFGAVGREVARRAVAFGMRVLFTDPVSPPRELIQQLGAEPRGLQNLLAESDFVSLHLPLSQDTHHRIGAHELACMKPAAFLVNTARGGLVDEAALYQALADKKLAGAAFDVFESEPPGESPLLRLENFVASPHAASATEETTLRMGWMAAENALAVLQGRRPTSVINPEVYDRRK